MTAAARPTRSRNGATSPARSSICPACSSRCTCVRVPVFTGHCNAISAEFERPISPERGPPTALGGRPVWCCPSSRHRSRRQAATSRYVGRIRGDPGAPHGLSMFIAGDNLRKGAALNAVQIAEELLALR